MNIVCSRERKMGRVLCSLLAIVLVVGCLFIQTVPGVAAAQEQIVYFTAPEDWSEVNFYSWYPGRGEITSGWPGDPMTHVGGALYSCRLPADAVNIIFNDGSVQTRDLTIPSGKDWYDYTTESWSVYSGGCIHPGHDTDGNCTGCGGYLGHSYVDGVCTVCGAAASVPVTDPGLRLDYPTLSFEDEIIYNVYFSVADPTSVTEMGLMLLSSKDDSATIDDAVGIVPGYATNGVVYLVKSGGIPAANMGDTLYFKIYAKLTDGSYAYSAAGGYSAKAYAGSILSGNNSAEMKALVVAMLDYGAEAQKFFDHNVDKLVNDALTAEQQALVKVYDSTMMDAIVKADSSKTTNFTRVNSNFRQLYPSVSFDGAFAINFYCAPAITVDDGMTLYWWDMETMASVDKLTVENATGSMEMTDTNGMWWGQVAGIAAKEMDKTYYVSCVFESDGEKITTGIIPYSLGKYCSDKAAADGDPQQAFAQATAVYGYYAKIYFRGASEPSVSGTYIVGEDELPYSDEQIYQQLFDPNTKLEIDLDMSDKELQKLQDDYVRYRDMGSKSPIYRLGDMTITMTTAQGTVSYVIPEVGARMKGNTSRTSFYNESDGIYKYIHFKFDFQETFDDEDYYGDDAKVWDSEEAREARKDRTFATLEKLEMRWNKLYDATYLKESYAYEVFRSEGVLAPQCNIGVLDWSGARMGIYTVEEPVDKVFIERNVSEEDAGGDLYKLGWTNEGATFTNTNSIGVEDEDKGKFYVYDLKTNKKKSTHKDLIRMIDTLNSGAVTKESFASVVDVDSFLRFAAVSYFMGNPDDLRNNYNNCYVYFLKSSGKAVFIPYDYDRCLGVNREYNPNGDSMTKDDPYGRGGQQSPLFRYSVDKGGFYTAEYTKVLLEVAENELLTADAFARRFAVAESLYAGQVGPERHLRNAEGRDFSFDLERTGSASGNSNMSFKDYMSAKMTAFRDYVGQSAVSGSKCYIRGDFNGWAIDSGYLMKKQGEVLVFTLDFDHRVSFKVYDDGTGEWMGSESLSVDTTVAWDTDDHTNIILEAGTYQVRYDPESKQITVGR